MIVVKTITQDNWRDLKNMRTEAIEHDPQYFFAEALDDLNMTPKEWIDLCTPTDDQHMFGLFDQDKIVGISMARNHDGAILFGGSYVSPNYRNKKIAKLLYQARLQWLKNNPKNHTAYVFHKEGHVKSEHLNTQAGAVPVEKRLMKWADGTSQWGVWYCISV